jgi:hypothetical protein
MAKSPVFSGKRGRQQIAISLNIVAGFRGDSGAETFSRKFWAIKSKPCLDCGPETSTCLSASSPE